MGRYFMVIIGIVALGIGFGLSSYSHAHATKDVAAIVVADNANQPTAAMITALKNYVTHHIEASVSFTLAASYNRALAASKAAATPAQAATIPNQEIYSAAQAACAGHTDSITQAKCVTAYVSARLVTIPSQTPAPTQLVTDPTIANYTYAFRSPLWTSDAAGLFFLGGIVTILVGGSYILRGRERSYV